MLSLQATVTSLSAIATAATIACISIDGVPSLEDEDRKALKDLSKAIGSLSSDVMVYKVLMNTIENDTQRSRYLRIIQR